MLVSCLAYSSTMKIEATCSSETSAYSQQTTLHCIPIDGIFAFCVGIPRMLENTLLVGQRVLFHFNFPSDTYTAEEK
jgi:hypothetical protein